MRVRNLGHGAGCFSSLVLIGPGVTQIQVYAAISKGTKRKVRDCGAVRRPRAWAPLFRPWARRLSADADSKLMHLEAHVHWSVAYRSYVASLSTSRSRLSAKVERFMTHGATGCRASTRCN